MSDWESLASEQQEALDKLSARCEELESTNSTLEERIQELEDQIDELTDENEELEEEVLEFENPSSRRPPPHFRMPDTRESVTHKFHIGMGDLGRGYITCGVYPDSNDLGEIFIKVRHQGEADLPEHLKDDQYVVMIHQTVSELTGFLKGVLDQLAIAVSIGLQRGIPLETYARKYRATRFPPEGRTRNQDIPYANSIVDYIFRWLGQKFIGTEEWMPPKRG